MLRGSTLRRGRVFTRPRIGPDEAPTVAKCQELPWGRHGCPLMPPPDAISQASLIGPRPRILCAHARYRADEPDGAWRRWTTSRRSPGPRLRGPWPAAAYLWKPPGQVEQNGGDLGEYTAIDNERRHLALGNGCKKFRAAGFVPSERQRLRFERRADLMQSDVRRHRAGPGREIESKHRRLPSNLDNTGLPHHP